MLFSFISTVASLMCCASIKLECSFDYMNFMWGNHIDYLEYTCIVANVKMEDNHFVSGEEVTTGSYNDVTSMWITNATNTLLPLELAEKFPNLSSLRVEMTDIQGLTKNDTEGLEDLTNLYLGKNMMSRIFGDTFANFRKLKLLFLNDNRLEVLHNDTFKKLTELQKLWLNGNFLTELHEDLLSQNKNLKRIYLEGNRLFKIALDIFSIPSLELVDLRGNICINDWTFDKNLNDIRTTVSRNCHLSDDNLRKSLTIMAQIIYELGIRNNYLQNQNTLLQIEKDYWKNEAMKTSEDTITASPEPFKIINDYDMED